VAYLEVQDLVDELGEQTLIELSDDEATGEINATRVTKAVEYAQGVVDSYARARYSLPLPVTTMVRSLNLDIAVFHLYKSRSPLTEGIYTVKKNAYDEAIKLLKDISTGKAALDIAAAEETTEMPATPDRILTNSSKNKFTDTALEAF